MVFVFENVNEVRQSHETNEKYNAMDSLSQNELVSSVSTGNKCGEVFLGLDSGFVLICATCTDKFEDLETFGLHIYNSHRKIYLTIERLPDTEFDDFSIGSLPIEDDNSLASYFLRSGEEDSIASDLDDNGSIKEKLTEGKNELDGENHKKDIQIEEKNEAPETTLELKSSTNSSTKRYPCNLCHRTFIYSASLERHVSTTHPTKTDKPKEIVCKYCDKQFLDKNSVRAHVKSDHPGGKKFVCPQCPKTFSNRFDRQQHINIHTGERPFKCPHCDKGFASSTNLGAHIRSHLQIKRHECSYCNKKFVTISEKRVHERFHSGEKLHQCDECGRCFTTSGKLSDHKRRHGNVKKHKCDICNKSFYTSKLLGEHKVAHLDDKPFICGVCGIMFRRKKALSAHKQLHSDVKKYVCSICDMGFLQYAGLYYHKKKHNIEK